ncbi:MAG: hypothetical protein CK424_06590 [Legionella sp.]|nr:MAG: hypothetical protein CK424_06590 [Legionella sp.]
MDGSSVKSEHICQCGKIGTLLHELTQSIQVIHAYAWGCQNQLQNDELVMQEFRSILQIICEHSHLMGNKIHSFSDSNLTSRPI